MSLSLGSAIVITLNLILAAYFFYTLVAIFKGGAPIPSRFSTVKSIMRLADIKPGDVVYDLGSGDGRILFAAHKLGGDECRYRLFSSPLNGATQKQGKVRGATWYSHHLCGIPISGLGASRTRWLGLSLYCLV
ncbi:hypothetical protein EBR25_10870 [bacterium]|nr:hypothetical protein [bacterium]